MPARCYLSSTPYLASATSAALSAAETETLKTPCDVTIWPSTKLAFPLNSRLIASATSYGFSTVSVCEHMNCPETAPACTATSCLKSPALTSSLCNSFEVLENCLFCLLRTNSLRAFRTSTKRQEVPKILTTHQKAVPLRVCVFELKAKKNRLNKTFG